MSRWGTVRLTRAHIGRELNKSRTPTEDDLIFVWVSFLADKDERNQRQPAPAILYLWKTHQRVECFKLNRSKPIFYQPRKTIRLVSNLGNSEDKSDAKIVSLPDSESGQHWTRILYTCSSKCQCCQSTGILNEVLSRVILAKRLCHMASKVFSSILTTAMCKCRIIRLFSITQTWTLFRLSD